MSSRGSRETAPPPRPLAWGRAAAALLAIALFTLAFRLPFFFRAVIDWDESTYIIAGQSLLNGHLPYTETWAGVKPPLAYAAYALFIELFGRSIIAVRLGGALCVALTSWCVFLIGRRLAGAASGAVAAFLCVIGLSALPGGQPTMTEHIALAPLLGATSILVLCEWRKRALLASGALFGVAAMIRLNLAYPAVAAGLLIAAFLLVPTRSIRRSLAALLVFGAGGAVPVLFTVLPYLASGQVDLWWSSAVLAPRDYAAAQNGVERALREHTKTVWRAVRAFPAPDALAFVLLCGVGPLGWLASAWRSVRSPSPDARGLAATAAVAVGTVASILVGGAAYPHYLLQAVPFGAVGAGLLLGPALTTRWRWAVGAALSACALLAAQPLWAEARGVVANYRRTGTATHGDAVELARHLRELDRPAGSVYFLTSHLSEWLMGLAPMSRITHPSDIIQPYLLKHIAGDDATAAGELRKLLARADIVVMPADQMQWMHRDPEFRTLLTTTLFGKFEIVSVLPQATLWRRTAAVPASDSVRVAE